MSGALRERTWSITACSGGPGSGGAPRRRRVVAQVAVLHRAVDRVEAKAVDAAVKPEADRGATPARTSGLRQSRSGCSG